MHTEPAKADPPKRERRWFQFSLRTLFFVAMQQAAALASSFDPKLYEVVEVCNIHGPQS